MFSTPKGVDADQTIVPDPEESVVLPPLAQSTVYAVAWPATKIAAAGRAGRAGHEKDYSHATRQLAVGTDESKAYYMLKISFWKLPF